MCARVASSKRAHGWLREAISWCVCVRGLRACVCVCACVKCIHSRLRRINPHASHATNTGVPLCSNAQPSQDWKFKSKSFQAPPDMSDMSFPSLGASVDDSKQCVAHASCYDSTLGGCGRGVCFEWWAVDSVMPQAQSSHAPTHVSICAGLSGRPMDSSK